MNATITGEGNSPTPRTGCKGTYANGVLTIICGDAPGSAQYCKVTLTRTGNVCPGQN